MVGTPNARIGDILRQCGMVTEAQLDEAQEVARRESIRIGEALMRMGILDRDRLAWALGVQLQLTFVDLSEEMIDWEFVRRFPIARLHELRLLPLSFAGGTVHAVVADPAKAQLDVIAEELFGGRDLLIQLADEDQILAMLLEARRQEQTPDYAFAPLPKVEDAKVWLEQCLEMLRADGEETFLVVQQSEGPNREFHIIRPDAVPPPPPIGGVLMKAILDLLPDFFVEEFPLPGGFAGLSPHGGAVRVTSLSGARGRTVVFQRIPRVRQAEASPTACRVRTRNVPRVKGALAAVPSLSFEAHLDFIQPESCYQFTAATAELRGLICRRVAAAFPEHGFIWEAASSAEAELAPVGLVDRLVVVQNDPSAVEDVIEGIGGMPVSVLQALKAAIEEAPHA